MFSNHNRIKLEINNKAEMLKIFKHMDIKLHTPLFFPLKIFNVDFYNSLGEQVVFRSMSKFFSGGVWDFGAHITPAVYTVLNL